MQATLRLGSILFYGLGPQPSFSPKQKIHKCHVMLKQKFNFANCGWLCTAFQPFKVFARCLISTSCEHVTVHLRNLLTYLFKSFIFHVQVVIVLIS